MKGPQRLVDRLYWYSKRFVYRSSKWRDFLSRLNRIQPHSNNFKKNHVKSKNFSIFMFENMKVKQGFYLENMNNSRITYGRKKIITR